MLVLRYPLTLRSCTALLLTLLLSLAARAQTPYKLSTGNYAEDFSQIGTWTNNFATGTGAAPFSPAPSLSGTTAGTTTVFATTSTSGGVQKGSAAIVLLVTGTVDGNYVGFDLNLDFSGTTAGAISLDWASVINSTAGNRQSTFKLQTNTGASGAFVDLPNSSVVINNTTVTSGQLKSLSLPTDFSGNAGAKIRFLLVTSGTAGTSGNRPKISLDNVQVTATTGTTTPPTPPTTATITTTPGTYASPWCITSSAASAAFNVAFTSTGTLTGSFQAQLSDANGAFANATSNLIGSATTSPISASIPAGTASGTAYRIRVLNGTTLGSDNGSNLTVNLAPATNPVTVTSPDAQSFALNATGTLLTASPTVASSVAWFYGTSATAPFSSPLPSTSATYQPKGSDFAAAGTYYVVAQATSTCGSVVGTSTPVQVIVTAAPPALMSSVPALPDFGTVVVGSASSAKSFSLSGTGVTGNVTITPPPGFEIRIGQTPFACCAIVLSPAADGSLATTQIDVRFAPQLAQVYSAKIAVTSPGLAQQDVAVTGTGNAATYPATVTTATPSAITTTTATAGGSSLDDGGAPVTAYGVAYGTDPEPTVTGPHTTDGNGLGTFTSSLTSLRPGVLYYVRAYATNAQGTIYGEQLSFTTVAVPLADEPTTSSTLTASNVSPARVLLTFTGGTGAKHLVLAHLNGLVNQDPTDATTYSANSTFGKGSVLGADADNYVVFAAAADTVTIFGLRPNTPYSFAVYDYNDNNTPFAENYRTSDPGVLSLTTPALPPTLLLRENFIYPAGTALTANNWAAHSGNGTKAFTVTSGNLTYPGYSAGAGNSTAFTGSGEDINRQFPTIYARTAVYVSFLVNVTDASTSGDYFLHLGPTVLSTNFRGRVFAKKSATGTLQFGVAGSGTVVYAPTDYAFNTTYLLLLKYSFDETGNETDLFVNPATSGTTYRLAATPDAAAVETVSSTPTDIGTIALRQGSSTPTLTIDAIGVATAFPLADAGPLPVTLTQFTAQASGRAVQLAWQTASEVNSDHFIVERSLDGRTFTPLQTVLAAGNSTTPRTYAALDAQAQTTGASQLYYRLRSVDRDGTSAYSAVQVVALTPAAVGLALFPNPTTNNATTLIGASAGERIQVLDALGRVITTATANANGVAQLMLPAGVASGVYVVRAGSQALRLMVK
ncbi:MAG: beta strand repeat-containing protein [Janthinobacterium lividum]